MMLPPQQVRRRRSQPHSCGYRRVRHPGLYSRVSSLTFTPDLSELSLGSTMKTNFANPDDILNFTLTIEPDEGMYKSGKFVFDFKINQNFPHDPPKVKCTQKIYHPNIDLEGNVCLNILREDWKPVLNLNAVIVGLQVSESTGQAQGIGRTDANAA
jgi:ubiquitin-protein ligase